ncbi:5-oxoprolinase subunit PxpB [Rossellomorea aquimaris]|uniref:5-oxoprolinase subunit PxpB n=1 Tax=Rossellomorea aquimaris TaxID=189382 RepID=UPI001CD24312|nr:5-oxoprolinase subunit PxpB [Rossellomorea aquimaris]MCA1056118.1 5-oxoprolinase subunit PxpB [Rossellomorea aquimaris]
MNHTLRPLGDSAVVIQLGDSIELNTHEKVKNVTAFFEKNPQDWLLEVIPAFTTVTLYYDPIAILQQTPHELPYEGICSVLNDMLSGEIKGDSSSERIIEIPVCYGGEFGPDLEEVARINGLTTEEVITKHSNGDYLVYMIGFAPGFPYVGGLDPALATPRRESPRLKIPAGSVGIAGEQTGVYPIETPGGWQLIGRTPLSLFQPELDTPSLLQAGDRIKFIPISEEEFKNWEESS